MVVQTARNAGGEPRSAASYRIHCGASEAWSEKFDWLAGTNSVGVADESSRPAASPGRTGRDTTLAAATMSDNKKLR